MPAFDRYLLRLFIKVLLVCFVSITGLYIVIDVFNNLDEFLGYGRQEGSLPAVLAEYYLPRIPWFFDRTSSLLALIAAMFAVTWLQRTRELTALLAAGIPKWRIVRMLIIAGAVVSVLAAINREVVIPGVRNGLTRNAQDWRGENARPVDPVRDNQSDIFLNGAYTYAQEQRIEKPKFIFDRPPEGFGRQLLAENAYYKPGENDRPAGYLLVGVQQPQDLAKRPSVVIRGRRVILSPHDTPWLDPDQGFVVSNVNFRQLAGGSQWRRLSSTPELIAGLRNPSLDYGLDAKVTIHARLVQPVLDMTLFFLGLPLVLSRENRNAFVAVGWCLLVVVFFLLVVTSCQVLGNQGHMLTPALAAWLPLMVFVPSATALSHPIFE